MIGKTLAHYEVIDQVGAGGMGTVFRARDTKLGRDVALKLLPEDFARDPERLARFRREAKVLASLNHANIASIHGLEEADGHVFLIMELAPGEDLAKRISKRGALPADEVIHLARQLAEGLEQAHERGVVHRDLKPANIMVGDDGSVKILDFGLARAYAGESAAEGTPENSPTITAAMTQAGTILGTAAYMSPEQARGREVDRRADIWAFGVILYEALTGIRLFEGESISDTLAGVLKTEPDFEALPDSTPVALRWLIERCLQKQPSSRLRDIGEARILLQSDLNRLPASSTSMPTASDTRQPRWVVPALLAAGLIGLVVGRLVTSYMSASPEPPALIHAALLPPDGHTIAYGDGGHLAIAPDGTRVAFVAMDSLGEGHLWVRRLDSSAAFELTGTEDATYPFWSPDGTKIGFFIDGSLRKIDAAGGVATTICDARTGRGGSWLADGRVLLATSFSAPISIVSAGGGKPTAVTALDSVATSHRWPHILPDGDHFLYTALGNSSELRWTSLSRPTEHKTLLENVYEGRYFDGTLLFGRDRALWSRPFDPETGNFEGEESLLMESIQTSRNFGGAAYTASAGGNLVYFGSTTQTSSKVGIFDLDGTALDEFEFEAANADDIDISSDGRYLLMSFLQDEGDAGKDLWIRDLVRGTLSRVTVDEHAEAPIWAPSQQELVYSIGTTLVIRSLVGARPILREVSASGYFIPHDWSEDGEFILATRSSAHGREIVVVPVDEEDEPWVLVSGDTVNTHPVFSHDGRWVAYMTIETGDPQIMLREFRTDGSTWQVSSSPSVMPRFGPKDEFIYYLNAVDRGIISTSMKVTPDGPEFGVETRVVDLPIRSEKSATQAWTLDATGKRVIALIDTARDRGKTGPPMALVVGWQRLISHGR